MTKECTKCHKTLEFSEFYPSKNGKHGFGSRCKTCQKQMAMDWERNNPEKALERQRRYKKKNAEEVKRKASEYRRKRRETDRNCTLQRLYGITADEYDALFDAQGGVCAICGTKPDDKRLAVDHDHETGKVRGLLCFFCNVGLGSFKEDLECLLKAASYVRDHSQESTTA